MQKKPGYLEKLADSEGDASQGGKVTGQVQHLCEAVDESEGGKASIGDPLGQLPTVHVCWQGTCTADTRPHPLLLLDALSQPAMTG